MNPAGSQGYLKGVSPRRIRQDGAQPPCPPPGRFLRCAPAPASRSHTHTQKLPRASAPRPTQGPANVTSARGLPGKVRGLRAPSPRGDGGAGEMPGAGGGQRPWAPTRAEAAGGGRTRPPALGTHGLRAGRGGARGRPAQSSRGGACSPSCGRCRLQGLGGWRPDAAAAARSPGD